MNFHTGRNKQFSHLSKGTNGMGTPGYRLKTADVIVGQRYSSENIFENDAEEDQSEYKSKVANSDPT